MKNKIKAIFGLLLATYGVYLFVPIAPFIVGGICVWFGMHLFFDSLGDSVSFVDHPRQMDRCHGGKNGKV